MRTRILDLNFDGLNVAKTPLLVPSFSSQAHVPKHHNITSCVQDSLSYISDTLLISAYDIPDIGFETDFSNLDLLFLDSGGYECIFENDYSDIGEIKKIPKEWSKKDYDETLDKFKPNVPTALVSYDNFREEIPEFINQITYANDFFNGKNVIKIFLAKAEIKKQLINIDKLLLNAESFLSFDILGFTEKELGHSILERMKNISKIRDHNDEIGINIPIHIFGSLDPISTPLYFLAGADIFDGLSWLRYTYHQYFSGYTYSIGSFRYGIENTQRHIWDVSVRDNYDYIKEMEITLREVHKAKTCEPLETFTSNSEFFEKSYYQFEQEVRGDN